MQHIPAKARLTGSILLRDEGVVSAAEVAAMRAEVEAYKVRRPTIAVLPCTGTLCMQG